MRHSPALQKEPSLRGRQARGTIQALPLASSVMGALFPGHPAGMGMQTAEKKAAGTQSLRRCGVTVLVSRGNTRSWRFLWEAVLNPDRSPGLGVQSLGFRQLFFYVLLVLFWFLFTYFWPCRVFIAACGLSLGAVSGGYSSLWSAGSRHAGFGGPHFRAHACSEWSWPLWLGGSRAEAQ